MTPDRKASLYAGILYLAGTATGIASVIATGPVRKAGDIFTGATTREPRLIIGALFIVAMGMSLAMMSVTVYPVLRRYNHALALGHVVFRGALEPCMYMLMATCWLLMPPLGRLLHTLGIAGAPFAEIGTLLYETPQLFSLGTVAFIVGAVMFYMILYRSALVPRWISLWGIIAAVPFLAADFLGMFGVITTSMNAESTAHTLMVMPLGIQEMVLAVWMIVRGFNVASATPKKLETRIA